MGFTYEPCASLSRLPPACLVRVRVVAILDESGSSNVDKSVHEYGPWLEVEPQDEGAVVSDSKLAGPKCTPSEEGALQHVPQREGLTDCGMGSGPPGGNALAGTPMPTDVPAMIELLAAMPLAADSSTAEVSPEAV